MLEMKCDIASPARRCLQVSASYISERDQLADPLSDTE